MIENQTKTAKVNKSGFLDELWFQVGVNFFQSEKTSQPGPKADCVPLRLVSYGVHVVTHNLQKLSAKFNFRPKISAIKPSEIFKHQQYLQALAVSFMG